MKTLISTNGYEILVSDEDFQYLDQWGWQVKVENGLCKGVQRTTKAGTVQMAREILKYRGINLLIEVDHIDRDTLNNQFHNLRPADGWQNAWNQKIRSTNTSGYKGVTWDSLSENIVLESWFVAFNFI